MYREVLQCLTTEELHENLSRLTIACEELRDCLESLLEEKDELLSCNQMYKFTSDEFKKLSSVEYFKRFEETPKSDLEVPARSKEEKAQEEQEKEKKEEEEEEKKQEWSEVVENEIQMPRTARVQGGENLVVPKLKIPRPKYKRFV